MDHILLEVLPLTFSYGHIHKTECSLEVIYHEITTIALGMFSFWPSLPEKKKKKKTTFKEQRKKIF